MLFRKLALTLFGPRQRNSRQMMRAQQRKNEKNQTRRFKRSPLTAHLAAKMHIR